MKNGSWDGTKRIIDSVSSASVWVNGVLILDPSNFNKNVYLLEDTVDLQENNTISVELASSPDSYITVEIIENIDPPTVSLNASSPSIPLGESSTLTWNSSLATSCIIEPDIGTVDTNGSIVVTPDITTTYTITATGLGGTSNATAVIEVIPPPTVNIKANPQSIVNGESTILTWNSTNASTCFIEPDIGSVGPSGTITVSPTQTTTYTVTASGLYESAVDTFEVVVYEPPTVSITTTPGEINAGESAVLSWNATNADTCIITTPDIGNVDVSGSITVTPAETVIYTISAQGPGGTATSTTTLRVVEVNAPPEVHFSHPSVTIEKGSTYGLSWTSQRADSVNIDNNIGNVDLNGSYTVSPESTTTYTVTAVSSLGISADKMTVYVTGTPASLPEGSFGKTYEDLIPSDATVDEYDSNRFALLTGIVTGIDDQPIQDVNVTVYNHPEYGTVKTDENGRYTIPVEGGGMLTLQFDKSGFLTSHRQVLTPWNDIAVCETVQLIAQDTKSTEITFDGNPETILTHDSTIVTDEFGSRSAMLVFSGDNRAFITDAQGNDVNELSTMTVRATEFETPETMPAKLPPNSAYTYCTELQVDGADRIRFEKPVALWIDNFLGFEVGEIVPVGYYDRDRAVWVPSDNGVVVKLLDTDNDGIADALDATGDDLADDLNNNGLFVDEVAGLDDPTRYSPGNTFWRSEIQHFTPWDCNWPYGPPAGAIAPDPDGMPDADQQQEEEKDCKTATGSFVEERSRIFHEDIPIPGTDMTLHYASNRVKGYKNTITIPASGATVPESLKGIRVKMTLAGRNFEWNFDPLPYQSIKFTWDGLDSLGKIVRNPIKAHISIGFEYNMVYYSSSSSFSQAFAQAGSSATFVRGRQNMITWKQSNITINPGIQTVSKGGGVFAQGWTLSKHHVVSPISSSMLHKGDGTTDTYRTNIITTVAGNGERGDSGDGGPATQAQLNIPYGTCVDSSGNLYIADTYNHRVRKIDTNGIITTVAGREGGGYDGDGGPAIEAGLYYPEEICVDSSGNLYIIANRIRKVDTNGIITAVAGNGEIGYSGDGGPATQALLGAPTGICVDSSGNLYIADNYNHRIRKVDANGIITTVAGNGFSGYYGYSGDGGPATQARLNDPQDICVDSSGNLYIADTNRIRKVDTSGIITTIAGNGEYGYSGDGGPAIQAKINFSRGICVDSFGNLYISETNRVRKIDAYGIITTVAGNGVYGYSGDGGPAAKASIKRPIGLCTDSIGRLYIADSENSRIFKVDDYSSIPKISNGIGFYETNGQGYIMSGTGLHQRTIDLDAGVTLREFGYDENMQLIAIIDTFGNQTTIQRDTNGIPTAIISPEGITTRLTIDADSNLTRITYPDNSHYDFEYTGDGLLTAKTEPEGNRFVHVFDSTGRLTDVTDDEGGHWNYTRTVYENGDILTEVLTGEGNLTSYLDRTDSTGAYTSTIAGPIGGETLFNQSADGLSVNKSLSCGMVFDLKYDLDSEYKYKFVKQMTESTPGNINRTIVRDKTYDDTDSDTIPDLITETITVNGKNTNINNNVLLSQRTLTSPEGRTTTIHYNPDTLVTESVSIPGLHDTNFGYNPQGRLTSIDIENRGIDYTYNVKGQLESATDSENHTTGYLYDDVGRVVQINRPDTTSVRFDYDGNGNMTVLTNPSTIDHVFNFNNVNLESGYVAPLSGSYSYTYDKDRQLTQKSFPSGNSINFIYDRTQLSQVQTPEGNIDYTYFCSSKIDTITKGPESVAYTWDGKLLTSQTVSGSLSQTIDYSYNNDFNLTGLTYAGSSSTLTYDNDGLLTGSGNFAINRNVQNGLPESITGGSLNLTRTFNGFGETESQTYEVNSQGQVAWGLTRDNNGRITNKTQTVNGTASSYDYTYDSMGRLLTVKKDSTLVEEYRYGTNGSRTYEMNAAKGIAGRTLAYSDEDHLLSAGDVFYSYDLDGFLSTRTQGSDVTVYDYSSTGELLSVELPDGTLIEYINDPLGRRIAKKVNGSIVEKYLWQGLTTLLAVYDGSDNLLMRFDYADGRMPLVMTAGGATYYLAYDQAGSLTLVVDASGNVIKHIEYDTFGNRISDSNPIFEIPFGFAGGLYDKHTGLVRFGHRDFDPETGRWTAKDPIRFAGGDTDLYGYVLNDPVNFVDPLGLKVSFIYRPMKGPLGAFGYHQAVKVNDRIVGYGPDGVHQEDPKIWEGRSHEVVLHEGNEYDDAYNAWLDNALKGNDPRFSAENYWSNNWPWSEGESCYTFCDAAKNENSDSPCD